jgi:hypothetical protein
MLVPVIATGSFIMVTAGCWVIASTGRTRRLALLISAGRGDTSQPTAGARPGLPRRQRQPRQAVR